MRRDLIGISCRMSLAKFLFITYYLMPVIEFDKTVEELKSLIEKGQKVFLNIDFGEGDIKNFDLTGVEFKECILAIDFEGSDLSGAKFVDSNIKTSSFRNTQLKNTTIENCAVESIDLTGADINSLKFLNNSCMGSILVPNEAKIFQEE